jgi:hypothetical protein
MSSRRDPAGRGPVPRPGPGGFVAADFFEGGLLPPDGELGVPPLVPTAGLGSNVILPDDVVGHIVERLDKADPEVWATYMQLEKENASEPKIRKGFEEAVRVRLHMKQWLLRAASAYWSASRWPIVTDAHSLAKRDAFDLFKAHRFPLPRFARLNTLEAMFVAVFDQLYPNASEGYMTGIQKLEYVLQKHNSNDDAFRRLGPYNSWGVDYEAALGSDRARDGIVSGVTLFGN